MKQEAEVKQESLDAAPPMRDAGTLSDADYAAAKKALLAEIAASMRAAQAAREFDRVTAKYRIERNLPTMTDTPSAPPPDVLGLSPEAYREAKATLLRDAASGMLPRRDAADLARAAAKHASPTKETTR